MSVALIHPSALPSPLTGDVAKRNQDTHNSSNPVRSRQSAPHGLSHVSFAVGTCLREGALLEALGLTDWIVTVSNPRILPKSPTSVICKSKCKQSIAHVSSFSCYQNREYVLLSSQMEQVRSERLGTVESRGPQTAPPPISHLTSPQFAWPCHYPTECPPNRGREVHTSSFPHTQYAKTP